MRVASHQASLKNFQPGDRVWAPWDCRLLYAGTVDQLQDTEVHVHFDDGKSGWVQFIQVMPLEIPVGLRVLGWKQQILKLDEKSKFCPGVVSKVNGDSIFIVFQDGEQAWMTTAALALPCQPLGPDARPTKVVGRRDRRLGIRLGISVVITIGFSILVAFLGVAHVPAGTVMVIIMGSILFAYLAGQVVNQGGVRGQNALQSHPISRPAKENGPAKTEEQANG
jgi:hypothetical protein